MKAVVAFGAVIYVASGLLLGACQAQPETVEGLMKKDKAWKVPIVAKQPNENKPTQVLGSYPELTPDTLARPLKSNRQPFGQFLPGKKSTSVTTGIPNHILQWLSQRYRTTSAAATTETTKPYAEEKKFDRQIINSGSSASLVQSKPKPYGQTSTAKPRLIQRPSYNPQLASASSSEADNEEKETTTEDLDKVTLSPRVAAIIMDDFMERQKDKLSVAGLVIGLTFVAAFIAIAVGLVGHGLIKRCRSSTSDNGYSGRSSRNSWMRSPGDDEHTPPELRPGNNANESRRGSGNNSRRNSTRTRHIPGTLPGHGGTPFFNGKLILHDPPGLSNGASRGATRHFSAGNVLAPYSTMGVQAHMGGFTLTSPPSKLGAIPKKMPSKADQVTDLLVSPKYDDGDTTEEEDSDDTVYECPGLAAKGTGLEVRNPFFLEGDLQPTSGRLANKKPISQYTDLFHHQEIAGLN